MKKLIWIGCLSYFVIGLAHVVLGFILPVLLQHYDQLLCRRAINFQSVRWFLADCDEPLFGIGALAPLFVGWSMDHLKVAQTAGLLAGFAAFLFLLSIAVWRFQHQANSARGEFQYLEC